MNRDKLADELEADEGFREHAYQDTLGYWTIGIGRLIDKRKGGRITKAEAFFLLDNDIEEKYHELITALPWVVDQPDHIQRALCNMSFQLGVPGLLAFKRTLALIQAKKYEEAANNALLSKWAKQTPNRAKRVTDMIRLGEE
jgi:lysozyme